MWKEKAFVWFGSVVMELDVAVWIRIKDREYTKYPRPGFDDRVVTHVEVGAL